MGARGCCRPARPPVDYGIMQEMHLPFDIGYAGAAMFLMCREIVEKFVDIVTRGQEIGFAVKTLRSAGPNAEDVPNVAVPRIRLSKAGVKR